MNTRKPSPVNLAYDMYLLDGDADALFQEVLLYFRKIASRERCPPTILDEVCQLAVIRVWSKMGKLYRKELSSFAAWSGTVWKHVYLNYLRDERSKAGPVESLSEYREIA